MPKPTDAEKAAEKKAAKEAAEEKASSEGGVEFDGEFDADRAKRAIAAARKDAKGFKAMLAEQAEKLEGFESAEAKAAEDDKSNEAKLVEKDAQIAALETAADEREVRTNFLEVASDRGYRDPGLAYLAAKEQGLLGEYNRKSGDVGDHDFEALEESHKQFATEAGRTGEGATGDAGARGGTGNGDNVGGAFNKAVRKEIARR